MSRGLRWPALLAVLLVAACSAAAEDKAGSAATVELTLANAYAGLEYEPAVEAFVDDVQRRSGGRLRIRVEHTFGGAGPDLEQRLLAGVAAGDADLGWVGTRVLDTVGVHAFEALTAPFLVDSYALQKAVLDSDLPEEMLPALRDAGVTGLALLAGGLRHPVSAGQPLATVAAWRGAVVQTFRSRVQSDALAALGAIPTDIVLGDLARALADGRVTGTEKSLLVYSLLGTQMAPVPHIVDDVVLWPETGVLFATPSLHGRLTAEQWGWLRAAATGASARSPDLLDVDQSLVQPLCSSGVRFTRAGPAALRELEDAEAPVYARLQEDPQTAAAIARIRQLAAALPPPVALDVPPSCRDTTTAGLPGSEPPAGDGPLVGVWETDPIPPERVRATYLAAGGTAEQADEFVALLASRTAVRFDLEITSDGWTQYELTDRAVPVTGWVGTYALDGSVVHALDGQFGCWIEYVVDLVGDTLALQVLRDEGASPECSAKDLLAQRAIYQTAPFTRRR